MAHYSPKARTWHDLEWYTNGKEQLTRVLSMCGRMTPWAITSSTWTNSSCGTFTANASDLTRSSTVLFFSFQSLFSVSRKPTIAWNSQTIKHKLITLYTRINTITIKPVHKVRATAYFETTLYFIFTTWSNASTVYAVVMWLFVCPSVTRWYCIKMAKCRITQTMPYDSPGTLSFLMPKISANF